jgi:predicted nucleic acid-binding protein
LQIIADGMKGYKTHPERAVLSIVKRGRLREDTIVGSHILKLEMRQISDMEKKDKVTILYEIAQAEIGFTESIEKRATEISASSSIRTYDALHIASAEAGGVDYLLTTDDKFEKAASKQKIAVKVMNPLRYITEAIIDE